MFEKLIFSVETLHEKPHNKKVHSTLFLLSDNWFTYFIKISEASSKISECLITISTFTNHSLGLIWIWRSRDCWISSKWICLIIAVKCYVMFCNAAHHKCSITESRRRRLTASVLMFLTPVPDCNWRPSSLAPAPICGHQDLDLTHAPVWTRTIAHSDHFYTSTYWTILSNTTVQMKRRTNQVIRNSTKTDSNCWSSSTTSDDDELTKEKNKMGLIFTS